MTTPSGSGSAILPAKINDDEVDKALLANITYKCRKKAFIIAKAIMETGSRRSLEQDYAYFGVSD